MTVVARETPFDAIAGEYDARFTNSAIGRAQRELVWRETDRQFHTGQRILEFNCGTGVDALHLAERGIQVLACDASAEMIAVARRRTEPSHLRARIDLRVLAIEALGQLVSEELYDGALSNFAGLNCVADLPGVARQLARLVKPGGRLVLCLFGRFCFWETVWYGLHGEFRKAFRRLRAGGVTAHLAPGYTVQVRYPSVASLRRDFACHFRLVHWKGVGIAVPPSYLEPWAARFGGLLKLARKFDRALGPCPGLRALADHVVIVLERRNP